MSDVDTPYTVYGARMNEDGEYDHYLKIFVGDAGATDSVLTHVYYPQSAESGDYIYVIAYGTL